jgi:hypothetical protein
MTFRIERDRNNAIILGFAGKPPLPDQLFSGDFAEYSSNGPIFHLTEVCTYLDNIT